MRQLIGRLRRRSTVLVLVALAALTLTGASVAAAATTGHSGTTVTRTAVVTQDTAVVYGGTTYANVGSLGIYALAGQWITVTFTAESTCTGPTGWCSVRILVDGVEAEPVVGTDYAFNSPAASGPVGWAGHSVTRVRTATQSTTHTVIVQTINVAGATGHRLDDWTLEAQVITP